MKRNRRSEGYSSLGFIFPKISVRLTQIVKNGNKEIKFVKVH